MIMTSWQVSITLVSGWDAQQKACPGTMLVYYSTRDISLFWQTEEQAEIIICGK